MVAALFSGLSRWIAATAIGIALAFVLAQTPALGPIAAMVLGACVVVVPLLIARRDPPMGAWLAMVLIASVPMVVWLMALGGRQPLVGYRGCGLGVGLFWIIIMPGGQTLAAIVASGLWRCRDMLAGALRPLRSTLLVVGFGVLCVGTVRTATLGPAPTREALLDTREALTVSRPAEGEEYSVVLEGLDVRARCEQEGCELSLTAQLGSEPGAFVHERQQERWQPGWVLSVRRVGPWRIVQLPHPPNRSYGDSIVLHDTNPGAHALDIESLAPWRGPSWGSLTLLAMALLGVLVTFNTHGREADVWRQLGARPTVAQANGRPNTVAMRAMHIAVVLVGAAPLMAEASLGLLG